MLNVRIARSWEEQERGLGGVKYMPEDEGMLFEFDSPRRLSFWGKDTYIPLDIAFVTGEIITKIARIKPMDLHTVASDIPANMAIEANAGFFQRHNIQAGDRIDITDRLKARLSAYLNHQLDADRCIIRFLRTGDIIEGTVCNREKEIQGRSTNSKVSQTLAPEAPAKVEKPDHKVIGDPIGQQQPQQTDPMNLPVLDVSALGAMLEDAYDEDEQQVQPEDQGNVPQEEQPYGEQPYGEPQDEQAQEEMPVFSNPFEAANWAQQNNEVMRIAYTTAHGRQLTRDVEPHGQFHSKSTHRQILVTWDRTIGDIRAFILQNIGSWAFTGEQFQKKFIVRG